MPRRIILVTLAAGTIALTALAYAVPLSLDPSHYFFYGPQDRAAWVYDLGHVAFVCAVILAEAALAWGVFVSTSPILWLRCLIGLALLGPWALLSTMVVVHAPGYVLFHHLWVWSLVGLLVLAAFASIVRCVYRNLRGMMKRIAAKR